jgi:glycosyltransferase involved in cell wall biosynthesis
VSLFKWNHISKVVKRVEDSMPKISIIMPAYNSEKFIAQAIESVIAQTQVDWELLIVNDGSKDNTGSIINSYSMADSRIKVIQQVNCGTGAARNRGMAEADITSEYIIFLDSDDCWEESTLEVLLGVLEHDPQAVAVHGLARTIDESGRPCKPGVIELYSHKRPGIRGNRVKLWTPQEPTCLAVLVVSNVIVTPGQLLIKKAALEGVGKFNTSLKNAEDWDLWLRLTTKYNIIFLNKVVINYRQHSNNKSKTTGQMSHSINAIYHKYMSDAALTKEQRKVVSLGYYWAKWLLSCLYMRRSKENFINNNFRAAFEQIQAAFFESLSFLFGLVKVWYKFH